MKLEPKPCPFCGTSNTYLRSQYSCKVRKYFVWAECDFCGARSRAATSQEAPEESDWENFACQKAMNAWNTRAGDANA